ncbi:MAG: DNA polymerase/3'-5' exonuclease PolX [Chloroflexi bacterium]|nr:DNA polymerase/3'-5' exonuclease PolX [Chloroflexota bacterium]
MNNAIMAEVMDGIAELLELKGESPFKVRAYRRASQVIEGLPTEVERMMREGRLLEIPGVGESIAKKIEELITTGQCEYYENLRREFPEGITRLMDVPGIGPKTAVRLSQELGVTSVDDLEQAVMDGRVAKLPRMGEKLAENILRHIRSMRRKDDRIPLGQALPVVEDILSRLRDHPHLRNLTPAGSLRRLEETVGDIDIIGTSDQPETVMDNFVALPLVKEILAKGDTKASIVTFADLQADLRIVEDDCFGSLLQHFTGSKQHNIALRERGVKLGMKISEYGITFADSGSTEKFLTEESFYDRMGLQFIPPELRQGMGEVEAAERKAIPGLVELSDIKGDLHVHTEWSDGADPIEKVALAAKARGYEYIAISDHSVGRGVARGLSLERLQRQMAEIKRINESIGEIKLLTSMEVDLRSDGTLDFPDEVLSQLDVVTASVHSAMAQDEAKMTERILKAIYNPHVDIIGHLSCRLIGHREPISFDLEAILKAAAETRTALEINAMPERLDLKDSHVRRAKEYGVILAINTDAHSVAHLDFMRFGVGVARRGWCQAKHVLNTRPLEEILAFLQYRKI